MRRILLLLVLCALAVPARAARRKTNQLLTVVTPVTKTTVPAHPHVNVIVRFSPTPEGDLPDPNTFRARLGRAVITSRFRPIVEDGAVVGERAELTAPPLHLSWRARNRLRFDIRSQARSGQRPRILHDVDRVRFRALAAGNEPPVASLVPPSDVIFPGVALQFDGSASRDPELDELTYAWDFGDDQPSTEVKPLHSFTGGVGDVAVRLTVSDGVASATDTVTLVECPQVDGGRTPGILRVDAAQALEFASVAPGASAGLTFTVANTDSTPTSQLRVQLRVDSADFSADPPTLDLGPNQAAPVTLTFAPTGEGHRAADVVVVASGSNRCALHLLAHGYGGTAPGTGPTMSASPLFYGSFDFPSGLLGILPDGTRFNLDTQLYTCQNPGGLGTGDLCVVDADCAPNGGTCDQTLANPFFMVDTCSDGQGALYLMSDEGTYTDPTSTDNPLSVTVLRLDVDANGQRTGARIVTRMTTDSSQLACDRLAPSAVGHLYAAEFRNVDPGPACFRSEQEALLSIRKGTGAKETLLGRIDAAEGLTPCDDDIDQVMDLNVSPDGLTVFASLEDGGLYQLRPNRPITPDIDEVFQLHPDGDIVTVITSNTGTTGLISVYRLSPEQAATGALHLADLTPCATLKVPNNQGGPQGLGQLGLSGDHPFAVGQTSTGSLDATLLVAFYTTGAVSETPAALPFRLRVQGVAAFALPAGSAACGALGVVSLEFVDGLTF